MTPVRIAIALFFFALCAHISARADTNPDTKQFPNSDSRAAVIELKGEINDFTKALMYQHFAQARENGFRHIVLVINSDGGSAGAALDMSRYLKRQNDLHITAYVQERALSAGAMIALACNDIAMERGSTLGACAPIMMSSSGLMQLEGAERAKAESPILADFYDSATRNGYDPLLLQTMVSVGRSVYWVENESGQRRFIGGEDYAALKEQGWTNVPGVPVPIDASDTILTVNDELGFKLGIARYQAGSVQEFLDARGYTTVERYQTGLGAAIVGALSSIPVRGLVSVVFMVSLLALISGHIHGWVPAIAVSSLALMIGVPLLTGYASWWEIILILIGIVLLAIEIFVLPGFGVAGLAGIFLVLAGMTLTFVPREPEGLPGVMPSLTGARTALKHGAAVTVGGMTAALLLWMWLQRFLPKIPMFSRLMLQPPISSGASREDALDWPAVGMVGRTTTDLRPGGTASFVHPEFDDQRIVDVISDRGFVAAGTEVKVREIEGTRVVVRAASS